MGGIIGGGGGGPMGMMGMDMGMHKMPIVGSFFQDPNEQHIQEQMQRAGMAYDMYRPFQAQARMNSLANSASMMKPANAALGQMYGRGAQIDMTQAMRNPMNPDMFNVGSPAANRGKKTDLDEAMSGLGKEPKRQTAKEKKAEKQKRAFAGGSFGGRFK